MPESVKPKKSKGAHIAIRVAEAEKEALEAQALETGFVKKDGSVNLSQFMRHVLLESHKVAVRAGEDLLLIPGAFTTAEGQADVEAVLRRVLAALNETPAPAPHPDGAGANGSADPVAPTPAPELPPAEQLAQVAAQNVGLNEHGEIVQTSPPEGAVVGTGASHTPAGEIPLVEAPAQTFCSNCGNYFPTGTHEPGGSLCDQLRQERLAGQGAEVPVQGVAEEIPDARPLRPDELEPEAQPPLGPPQPGETEISFMGRRVTELTADGRPSTIARAEAGAEWRRAAGGVAPHPLEAPAAPPADPAPGLIPPQPQAPTHRYCGGCGAVVAVGVACPDCGSIH